MIWTSLDPKVGSVLLRRFVVCWTISDRKSSRTRLGLPSCKLKC